MSLHEFSNKAEMKNFAYEGTTRLGEETVKSPVARSLRDSCHTVSVGKKRERGPDIRASREGLKLIVEAKGEGTRNAMLSNFLVGPLGETLQRMSEQAAEYGIALPAHRKFARLVEELPDNARFVLKLNFYLARPTRAGDFEVGFLKWGTR